MDVIAKFTDFNTTTKTRAMTTTTFKSRPIFPRQHSMAIGTSVGIHVSSGSGSSRGLSLESSAFIFGVGYKVQNLERGYHGYGVGTGETSNVLWSDSMDVTCVSLSFSISSEWSGFW